MEQGHGQLMTFAAQILTRYPEMFPGPLGQSLSGRALMDGKWSCDPIQIRDVAAYKHRSVDETPAGGGADMVMRSCLCAAACHHDLEPMEEAPGLSVNARVPSPRQ